MSDFGFVPDDDQQDSHGFVADEPAPPPANPAGFLATHQEENAAQVAKAKEHATELGVTVPIALADPAQAQRAVDGSVVQKVSEKYPKVGEWVAEDPSRAALVREDVGWLADIGHAIHSFPVAVTNSIREQELVLRKGVEGGAAGQEGFLKKGSEVSNLLRVVPVLGPAAADAAYWAQKILPDAGAQNRAEIESKEGAMAAEEYQAQTPVGKAILSFAKMGPQILGDIAARVLGTAIGVAAVPVTGPVGPVVGGFAGSAAFNAFESFGPLYWRISQIKDADGKQIDPEVARATAMVAAGVNGGLMSSLFGSLGSAAVAKTIGKQGVERVTAQSVEKLLAEQGFVEGVKKFAKSWTKNQVTGAMLMAASSAANASAVYVAKQKSGIEADATDIANEAYQGGKQALTDLGIVSALHPTISALHGIGDINAAKKYAARVAEVARPPPELADVGKLYRSAEHASQLDAMLNGSKMSKVLELSPKEFESYVTKMKEQNGAVQSIGIPLEAFNKYWESKGGKPEAVATGLLGDGGRGYSEANATGGDVVVPLEKFLSRLGKTDHAKELAHDSRLYFEDSSDTFTPNEAKMFMEQHAEASRYLSAKHDAMSPEDQLKAMFIDPNTGLPNERASSRVKDAPGDLTMDVDQEGTKFINDLTDGGGHAKADEKSREFGSLLNSIAPNRVYKKDGGGFQVRGIKTEAEAKALQAEISKRSNKAFAVTGHVAESPQEASKVHGETKSLLEKKGLRAPRGKQPLNYKGTKDLTFNPEQAKVELHPELREQFSKMHPDETFKEIYTDKETGLLSGKGWGAIPRKSHVLAIDLNGLKALNDKYGAKSGDNLLLEFGKLAKNMGGAEFDFAHLHGDEFIAQSNDLQALQKFRDQLQKTVDSAKVGIHGEGNEVTGQLHGIEFGQAIGPSEVHADKLLILDKQRQGTGDQRNTRVLGRVKSFELSETGAVILPTGLPDAFTSRRNNLSGRARSQNYARARRAGIQSPEVTAEIVSAFHETQSNSAVGVPLEPALQGMDPKELEKYTALRASAQESAIKEVQKRAEEIIQQRTDAAKRGITEEVTNVADAHPVYRATRFLQRGELPDGNGGWKAGKGLPSWLRDSNGQQFKLDRAEVLSLFGEDAIKEMPTNLFSDRKAFSLPVEDLAGRLGFDSGEDFVNQLRAHPPRDEFIARTVQDRLDEMYGPAMKQLQEAAIKATHNDKEVQAQLLEQRALAKQVNPEAAKRVQNTDPKLLKEQTQRLIGDVVLGALEPNRYQRQERAALQDAAKLWGAGEREKSLERAEARLFNGMMYREAAEQKAQAETNLDKLYNATNDIARAAVNKASPNYLQAYDAILQAVGLVEGRGQGSIETLLQQAEADSAVMDFDTQQLKELLQNPKPWKALTVNEAQNVTDAITNIRTAAREKNQFTYEGKVIEKEALISEMSNAAKMSGLSEKVRSRDPALETRWTKAANALRWGDGYLTDVENLARDLDGGKVGPFTKMLVDARIEARTAKDDLSREFLPKIQAAWDKLPKQLQKSRFEKIDLSEDLPLPEELKSLGGQVSRSYLWMIALNTGNEGNFQRLTSGYGWTREQVMAALDKHMSKAEWQWVQGVWDSLNSLYPHIARVHERETGLAPEKVVATPVVTKHGTFEGGYFPAKYDPRVEPLGERQQEAGVSSIMAPFSSRPGVRSSHAKARAERFDGYVNLDWSVVPSHVNQVLHDVAYRSYVKQTAGMLLDPRVKEIFNTYLGEERASQMVPWLQNVANASADALPKNLKTGNKVFNWIRNKASMAAIGYSIPVAAGDLSNLIVPVVSGDVKASYVAKAMVKMSAAGYGDMRKFVLENSAEMRYRADNLQNNMMKQLMGMGASGDMHPARRAVIEHAFVLQDMTDKLTNTPVWMARYQQSIAEGSTHEEAKKDAERVVRTTSPSHDIGDKSAMLRDKRLLGGLLLFQSYMNKIYNLDRRIITDAMREFHSDESSIVDKVGTLAAAGGKLAAIAWVTGAASDFLSGRGKEDDESWADYNARRTMVGLVASIPFVGLLAEAGYVGYQRAAKGKKTSQMVSVRQAPLLAGVESAAKIATELGSMLGGAEGKRSSDGDKAVASAELLLGAITGAPTLQAHRTLGYGNKLLQSQTNPRGPFDITGGLVYGEKKRRTKNPFTATQDLVSGE